MGNLPPSWSRNRLRQCSSSYGSAYRSNAGRQFTYTVGVTNTVEIQLVEKHPKNTRYGRYSQETLQNKNIHKYKAQMIYRVITLEQIAPCPVDYTLTGLEPHGSN